MDNMISQSETFFFISSVGFVVLGVFVGVLLFYLIRISQTFDRIIAKAERDIDSIGDTTKEMIEEVRESSFFLFLTRFLGKRKKIKAKSHN